MADRRTFLQGLAATVAIPATVSARAADATEPDAELIALGQEWATSRERLDAAWEAHEDACDRWDGGPPPAAELFVRKFDSPLSYSAVRYNADKVRWYGRPEIVERLRCLDLEAVPEIHRTDGILQPAVPDLKARARRDEIVGRLRTMAGRSRRHGRSLRPDRGDSPHRRQDRGQLRRAAPDYQD